MNATVGIRELRQNLSAVLRRVEAGERLLVTERNRPVAELAPLAPADGAMARLVAEGRVAPPRRPFRFDPVTLGGDRPGSSALESDRAGR